MKPNILFILIDDLGAVDLGCCGSTFYETPCLDKMAAEGIRFTDAYAAAPVCSPTRASLLSGKYPARVGITQWIGGHGVGRLCDVPYFHRLMPSEYALPRALNEKGGYQTWHVGKWHLGDGLSAPERHGFDVNIGGCEWGSPRHGYFSPYRMPHLEDGPEGEYLTDRLTDEAIRLIKRRDAERPFFLHLSHYAVHTPIQAPETLVEKYRRKAAKLGLDRQSAIVEGENFPFLNKRSERVQRRILQSDPTYAAMVENLDTNIGRLLDALQTEGILENTLVIFTSDNGGLSTAEGSPTCNAPFAEGKGWMYEGGNREPLIIRGPGVAFPGSTSPSVVTSPDFYPTLLAVAGVAPLPEQHPDGKSFLEALGGAPTERGPVYWHYPHYSNQGGTPGCAVRDGEWKLIHFFEDGHNELYHLSEDPGEEQDVSAAHPGIVQRLWEGLEEWRVEVGGLVPAVNWQWDSAKAD